MKQSQNNAIKKAKKAEQKRKKFKQKETDATKRVREIETKLKRITKQIDKFERTKFGGWTCSRVTARGCVLT